MVNVSMGYKVKCAWKDETNYAEGANTTFASTIQGMGIVTDFTLTTSVTRKHIYGVGNQVRVNDPILSQGYEWSITMEWQNAATDSAMEWINDIIDNYGTSAKSYCLRIDADPDGSTTEILYLEGCLINTVTIKASVGDTVTAEVTGYAKELLGDDWSTTLYPTATDVTVDTTDPEQWHGSDVAGWSNILDCSGQIQEFTVEINYNSRRIDDFDSGGKASLGAQEGIEINWSATMYGDGTTMGDGGIIEDMIGDKTDNIAWDLDGTNTLTLTGASIDSISMPFKEKELIIIDMSGRAHSVTL